ncbi:MAG: hypothetical protein R6U39_01125 [Candidatus Aegiribacteria sp.]
MTKLAILTIALFTVAGADEVWTFPFDELGAEWTVEGYWTITGTGGYTGSPGSVKELRWTYSTMASGQMTLPEGIDSITVEMNSGYDYYGYAMDGGSQVSMEGLLSRNTDETYTLVDVADGVVTWDYASYSGSDTTSISQVVPIDPGDVIELEFTAGRNSYGYIYYVSLFWSLWDMTITGHGSTGLSRRTWAGIKSSI